MAVYIVLSLIIALLVYNGISVNRKISDMHDTIDDLVFLLVSVEEYEVDETPIAIETQTPEETDEAKRKAAELEKMYSEGLMNILTYGTESRRKKDE